MNIVERLFPRPKPVIAMVHFPPLPGRSRYDAALGLAGIYDRVRQDMHALQAGGVDGLLFCNEQDLPYSLSADAEIPATMAHVIGRLRANISVPFGVNVLWDPLATIRLAAATGAAFAREVFTGVYESDMGLWSPRGDEAFLLRKHLGCEDLAIFNNITPEFARSISDRSVTERARAAAFFGADALLISGKMAGQAVDTAVLADVKAAVPDVPLIANTGVNQRNVGDMLAIADAVIVGTAFKEDGYIWNPVDPQRVRTLVRVVEGVRRLQGLGVAG